MNDLINSIKLFFYERASNPLIAAFCLSWLVFNYQFIIIFFSAEDLITKLHFLSELYDSNSHFPVTRKWTIGLLYPLITAIIYIFAFPYLTRYVIKFHYQKATELKNIKNLAEGEALISNKKAREIQSKIYALEAEKEELEIRHKSEIKAFQEQITGITDESNTRLKVMQKSLADLNIENSELKSELEKIKKTAEGIKVTKDNAERNIALLRAQLNDTKDIEKNHVIEHAIKAANRKIPPSINNHIFDAYNSILSKSDKEISFFIISNLLKQGKMTKEQFNKISKFSRSETGAILNQLATNKVIKHEKDSQGIYFYSLTDIGMSKLRDLFSGAALVN